MDTVSNLPLSESTFLILLSLAPRPKHGYAIMKDVETLSDGRVLLSTGTLYGAIKRMLEQEWIERFDEAEVNGRERKAYRLTNLGQRILKAETVRMHNLVMAAHQRAAGWQP